MSETVERAKPSSNGSSGSGVPPQGSSSAGGAGSDRKAWSDNPWPRRIATAAALLVAAALLAYGCSVGQRADDAGNAHPSVLEQYPAPGGRALRQTEVGAQLEPGFDGRLTVNGVAIPEDQMEGAIDPSTVTEEFLRQYGIRPQDRDRVVFRPGAGKVIEEFEPGPLTISLRYFPDRREEGGGRTVTWTVTIT